MSPHSEAEEADCRSGEYHRRVAEQGLPGEDRQDLGHDSHCRQDQDVDLWVSKKPEQMLPENWVPTTHGREEESSKLPIEGDHEERHRNDRNREQQ